MDYGLLLPRQSQSCITCPDPPPCDCTAGQQCIQISRSCDTCASFSCVSNNSAQGGGSGGVSGGAVAGAVVGSLILLGAVLGLFLWNRRRTRTASIRAPSPSAKDVPASASDVLNRPDPNEKAQVQQAALPPHTVVYPYDHGHIDLDPESQNAAVRTHVPAPLHRDSAHADPFEDSHSIQTTSTGTRSNVIPIALVPRSGLGVPAPSLQTQDSATVNPPRPSRSPDLSLNNLDHLDVSRDPTSYSPSQPSAGTRHSYMSGATSATDWLNEAPAIITSAQSGVRQVLGVVKAEVVQAPHSPMPGETKLQTAVQARPSVRSPLAATSFGPSDVLKESDEDRRSRQSSVRADPFADQHSMAATAGTLGGPPSSWALDNQTGHKSRPVSMATMATNAGTIIADISSATRVNVGFGGLTPVASAPATPATMQLSPAKVVHRMTSGRLVSPPSSLPPSPGKPGTLQEQQERALAHAQALARDQGQHLNRKYSTSSAISSVSTRADTILESFPFVPPSPISDRPARTSPRSPLNDQSFAGQAPPMPTPPLSPLSGLQLNRASKGKRAMGPRASQVSTASTGLGSFTFHIGNDHPVNDPSLPPSSAISSSSGGTHHRQRASLDTVALTSELATYPLEFDEAAAHFPPTSDFRK